ncbi:MAG: Acetyltransferase domain [Pseudomonadota bacterium]|jgi:predicted N-acetyltransferase YhbS
MLHFSFERQQSQTAVAAKILDSAFSVESYSESFPHVFSEGSSAVIACARNSQGTLLGLCGVDTEYWSEPQSLRGACIGSVAVDPSAQGQGVGTALLSWVIDALRLSCSHDFIYLFSAENRFYESLGFKAVGRERLFAFELDSAKTSTSDGYHLSSLRQTTDLVPDEQRALWQVLEQTRLSGESHAGWLKFLQVCSIPDLWVAWIAESSSGRIRAGGFVGKGIDFRGVMHNLFACSNEVLNDFLNIFSTHHRELSKSLLLAPGLWTAALTQGFTPKAEQNLCYVLPLTFDLQQLTLSFNEGRLYPRSLFSS